jgi:hypothetical protein
MAAGAGERRKPSRVEDWLLAAGSVALWGWGWMRVYQVLTHPGLPVHLERRGAGGWAGLALVAGMGLLAGPLGVFVALKRLRSPDRYASQPDTAPRAQ